jgi:hypothetical protein
LLLSAGQPGGDQEKRPVEGLLFQNIEKEHKMKANTLSITNALVLPLILGAAAAVIVYAVLTGKQLPLIGGPRAALIALLIVGMAMCGLGGIGQVGASGKWTSPLAIAGYLLGTAILVVILSAFTGWKLPLIQGEAQAVAAVGGMMLVKFLIGTASLFLHLL